MLRSQGNTEAQIDEFFDRACSLLASVCGPEDWAAFFLSP
jgi:hypothetical protein